MGCPDKVTLFGITFDSKAFQSPRRGMGCPDSEKLDKSKTREGGFNPLDGAWAVRTVAYTMPSIETGVVSIP